MNNHPSDIAGNDLATESGAAALTSAEAYERVRQAVRQSTPWINAICGASVLLGVYTLYPSIRALWGFVVMLFQGNFWVGPWNSWLFELILYYGQKMAISPVFWILGLTSWQLATQVRAYNEDPSTAQLAQIFAAEVRFWWAVAGLLLIFLSAQSMLLWTIWGIFDGIGPR